MTSAQQIIRERVAVMFDGCWIWLLGVDKDGYGKLRSGGRDWRAHRFSYEAFRGLIPEGKTLDHIICDQPACVNPWHLEPRTVKENTLRSSIAPAAVNARKTHCPRGHELAGENLQLEHKPSGRIERKCRECSRAKCRRYYADRKQVLA